MREAFVDHACGRGYRRSIACRSLGGRCSDGLLSRVAHVAERGARHSRQARPTDFVGCQSSLAGDGIDRLLHDRDWRRFPVRHPASGIAEAFETLTTKFAALCRRPPLRPKPWSFGAGLDPFCCAVPELTRITRIKLNRRVSLRSQPEALAWLRRTLSPRPGPRRRSRRAIILRPTASFLETRPTWIRSLPRVRMMSEHDRSKATTPKDLTEQFRQLKILRAKVRQAEAKLSRKPGKGTDRQQSRDLEIERFAGATPSRTTSTKRDWTTTDRSNLRPSAPSAFRSATFHIIRRLRLISRQRDVSR